MEYIIASVRGRNPDNPSERTRSNGIYKQRIEFVGGGKIEDVIYRILQPVRTDYAKKIRKDYENHRIQERMKNLRKWEPRIDEITNTITTVQKDNYLTIMDIKETIRRLDKGEIDFSDFTHEEIKELIEAKVIRIRKLTPRECFRLMGVDDADIDKIQAAGISQSQQYKMAGNSIVVDVLTGIFDKLLVHTEPTCNTQLTLF